MVSLSMGQALARANSGFHTCAHSFTRLMHDPKASKALTFLVIDRLLRLGTDGFEGGEPKRHKPNVFSYMLPKRWRPGTKANFPSMNWKSTPEPGHRDFAGESLMIFGMLP
jgi:hypothetical protein